MNKSEIYDKIIWIYKIPEIFFENSISKEKLKNLPVSAKQGLIFKLLETLSLYFSVVPDYYCDNSFSGNEENEDIDGLNATFTIWLNGLGDLSISKIIDGLLDILNMKTEYQKWPPKSVMQFHAVCKSIRPCQYHEINNRALKSINDYNSTVKSEKIAEDALREMYKVLGKDYDKLKIERIKKASI